MNSIHFKMAPSEQMTLCYTNSIYNGGPDDDITVYVGASLLDGTVTGDGTEICVFSYDGTYDGLDSACQ